MPRHYIQKELQVSSGMNGYGTAKQIVEIIEKLRQEDHNVKFVTEEYGGGYRTTFTWQGRLEL